MSIKQSIATLVILLSVSFSASAKLFQVVAVYPEANGCISFGDVYDMTEEAGNYVLPDVCAGLIVGNGSPSTHLRASITTQKYLHAIAYNENGTTSSLRIGKWAYATECPIDTELNPETNKCEEKSRCEKLKESDPLVGVWWVESAFGSNMLGNYWCASASKCTAQLTDFIGCDPESGKCFADAYITGDECEHGDMGGFCSDSTCSDSLEGNQNPDPEPEPEPEPEIEPEDPTHNPDDPTLEILDPNPLPDKDPVPIPPIETEDKEEVEDPITNPDIDSSGTDTAVVKAITGMNADMNKALNELNLDINQGNADIQNQIQVLNASVVQNSKTIQEQQKNDNKIYENTKALIQQANADITTAVNKNTNAINAIGDDVEGMAEGLGEIGDAIDGLGNLDLSGVRDGTCPYNVDSDSCTGYYEVMYPDGFEGIVDEHFTALQTDVTTFVDGMFVLDVSNGVAPSFCMDVMQFGRHCFTDYFDLSWVFTFIRAAMMFSTVLLSRKLVFGG